MPGSTRSFEFAKRLVQRGDTVYMVTANWQGQSKSSFSKADKTLDLLPIRDSLEL